MSTKSTYGIRAMVDLARSPKGQPERLGKIAERQKIPLPYLEQIFSKLKKAGLVQAVRGPSGGYQLSKDAREIFLGDIITCLEGPLQPVLCSHPENRSEKCHDVEGCMSRLLCRELDGAVSHVLYGHTLAGLCGEAERLSKSPIFNSIQGATV